MSDDKNLKDEELDAVSGGARSATNLGQKPVSATGEGEIDPDLRIPGGGGRSIGGNPHPIQ